MENERADAGRYRPNPSREIKFSGADGDRKTFISPVQLTTRRIGNPTRLIHTLLKVLTNNNISFNRYSTVSVLCIKKNINASRPSEHPPGTLLGLFLPIYIQATKQVFASSRKYYLYSSSSINRQNWEKCDTNVLSVAIVEVS